MLIFYFIAVLILWQGIVSLAGGFRYLAFVRREMNDKQNESSSFQPFASVIAPCRGVDQGLRENLAALFVQQYPAYEVIFVADSATDAALCVVEDVRRQYAGKENVRTQTIIAGQATDSGQKVHNLRAAVRCVDGRSEAFVFVDTDARPRADWLASLIAPLENKETGAATGYRWYVPVRGGFASRLRAVWNGSIASALGERVNRNFCWGGSTAIRRDTFARLNMPERWRGTLSDDFTLMRALREAKLPIRFVPNCLTASFEDCSFKELLEFTTRQMKITRVYAAHFWKISLVSNLLFVIVFFGGIALTVLHAVEGRAYKVTLAFVLSIYALGTAKSFLRLRAVSLPLAMYRAELRKDALSHLILWPLASALYLYNAIAAARSRRIEWRGIVYELKSPTETVIISSVKLEENAKASGEARGVS
ncbi:MAG: glycosyltransferase family 2 protein [Pyrinomonadaceae bacterium]